MNMTPPSGETVREQLEMGLTSVSYERCFHLLCEMHCRLLSPDSFRAKMKFLLGRRLLTQLNPMLPDEYQFSDQELAATRDYRQLKKLEEGVKLVNELTKALGSAEDLGNFNELVKSHRRKEIDSEEFYESAYNFLGDPFDLMKKLGCILGDPTNTPSYIRQPTKMVIPQEEGSDAEAHNQVLNNSLIIYKARASIIPSGDPYHIYRKHKVIEECSDKQRLNGMTSEKRKQDALYRWDCMRCDLDIVLDMLTVAEKEVQGALGKIKSGKWRVNVGLREHLEEKGVKVKLLEMRFGELQTLMREPLESLPVVVNELRLENEEVIKAISELNKMHKELLQRMNT